MKPSDFLEPAERLKSRRWCRDCAGLVRDGIEVFRDLDGPCGLEQAMVDAQPAEHPPRRLDMCAQRAASRIAHGALHDLPRILGCMSHDVQWSLALHQDEKPGFPTCSFRGPPEPPLFVGATSASR